MPAARMTDVPFSGIREVFEECNRLEADGMDVVHLEVGAPDFDTPQPIKDAAVDAIDRGEVYYTSNYGIEPLRERIAAKLAAENGIEYDVDEGIIVTAGATEAVFLSFLALADRGDEVLIPDPSWTYPAGIRLANATPVRYPLKSEAGFQPDVEAIADRASDDTELLVVNTPHNPTGGVLDADHAAAIRDVAVEHDLTVLSDEIYEKVLHEGTHRSLAAVDGLFERTVTINGFSKAYSMTGWRLGYLAAPESLIDPILRARQYTTTCAPSISQHAGVRALEGDLHEPLVEAFSRRRDLVVDRIDAIPELTLPADPAGAFYAFPALPDGVDDREFAFGALREAGVAMVPGGMFGPSGEGHIRLAYANSAERIDEAFDRLEAWLAERPAAVAD